MNYVITVNAPQNADIEVEYTPDENGEIQIINSDAEPDIINEYTPDNNGDVQIINGD